MRKRGQSISGLASIGHSRGLYVGQGQMNRPSTSQAEYRLALLNGGQLDIGATPQCPFVPGQPPAQQLGGLAAAGGPGRAVTGVSEGLGHPVRRMVVAE